MLFFNNFTSKECWLNRPYSYSVYLILRYDLGEDFSIETAVVFGELYKNGNEWKFNAIGSGYQGGLAALCNSYGIAVE